MMMRPYVYNGMQTFYWIYSDGRVYSLIKHRFLKPYKIRSGYWYLDLYIGGKRVQKGVHQIVAETFLPRPGKDYEVHHIDHNKDHNYLGNLEWVTHSANVVARYQAMKAQRPEDYPWETLCFIWELSGGDSKQES